MEISRHWRLRKQRYLLVGEECPECKEKIFPPRDVDFAGHNLGRFNEDSALRRVSELMEATKPVKGAELFWINFVNDLEEIGD